MKYTLVCATTPYFDSRNRPTTIEQLELVYALLRCEFSTRSTILENTEGERVAFASLEARVPRALVNPLGVPETHERNIDKGRADGAEGSSPPFLSSGRESGQNNQKNDKNWGIARRPVSRRQVYDELEGWPPVSRAERQQGREAFPRDKEGVKIWKGAGCCDGEPLYAGLRLVPVLRIHRSSLSRFFPFVASLPPRFPPG